jgi:hypothetical protein
VAHKQKYARGAVGHMLAHYDRSKEIPGLSRPRVRSLLEESTGRMIEEKNYNLARSDQPQPQLEFLHQRLSEIKVHKRKDVNVMVDWIVTVPKDLPENKHEQFFMASYEFLTERYEKENVISAYVHVDETTPHMHYAFVPVIADKKTGKHKLSAKEVITRDDLRSFHGDLSNHLEKKLGHKVSVLNEATREGNRSIADLKRESAVEQTRKVAIESSRIKREAKIEVEVTQGMLFPIKAEYEAKKAFLEECEAGSVMPPYAKISTKGILSKKEFVTVPKAVWEARYNAYIKQKAEAKSRGALDDTLKDFRESVSAERWKELTQEVKELKSENRDLKTKLSASERKFDRLSRIFDRIPDEIRKKAEKDLKIAPKYARK